MRRPLIRGSAVRPLALLALLFSVLVTTLVAPLAARADDDAVRGKTFVIATDTTFAPFEYRDESGNMTGIDIDLINKIAEMKGFTVDIKAVGFDAALQAVQSRQADGVIAGMSITDERQKIFDFSDPYFSSGVQMAVKDGSDITSYADLKGQTVVAKTGAEGLTFAESIADQYGFTVKALDKADTMYSEVTTGNAAAVFDDYPVLAYGISQGNGLKIVTPKEQGSSYGFAVLKGENADLLEAFNSGLAELRADGTYHDILVQYLGDNAPEDSSQQVEGVKGETFVIATDTTFAPFEFRDASGNMTGIDVDLMKEVAERQGFDVEVKALGFDAALQAVQAGQADGVIAGMSITDERKKIFDFSDPYFDSGVQMAVAADDDSITGYADLEGKTVVAKTGAEGLAFAQSIADEYGFTVKALDKADTMYSEVQTGNAAAVFDDYPVLAYGISQGNGLKIVTPKEQGSSYGFAVLKGQNEDLLKAFNIGLQSMKEDGTYQQIMDKYLATGDTGDGSTSLSFWGLLAQSWPALMQGLGMTLAATALSLLFATVLGVIFGFFKVSGVWILKLLGSIYVDVFRGTPLLVQAFFFYFGLPAATGLKIDVFVAGVLTLSLNAGAYMTEIVRGGIQNVDTGQMEASRSLGLNWMQSMRKIIVPQALKIMTPSAINQFVITLKDTSLLAVLGLAELTYQGQQIIARTFRSFEMWLIIGAIYFVVIFALTKLSNALDRRINK